MIVKVELYTESKGKYRQKALSYGKGPPKTKVIVNINVENVENIIVSDGH